MKANSSSKPKCDVHRHITDQIVSAIERGTGPVELPWHSSGVANTRPTNALTSAPYRGINIVSLWASAMTGAHASGHWATFRQWRSLGANVRKGEKGSPIVFYKSFVAGQTDGEAGRSDGANVTQNVGNESTVPAMRLARTSWVFNAEQVDGWSAPLPVVSRPGEIIANAEAFVNQTRAVIRRGGDRAAYLPRADVIEMPARESFTGTARSTATESYYGILFHELTHWSGHSARLDRDLSSRFGDQSYAMEELVAELGASFLCAECTIASQPRDDHASYISHWLKVLKSDSRAIFTAASKASEAAGFLTAFQNGDLDAASSRVVGES